MLFDAFLFGPTIVLYWNLELILLCWSFEGYCGVEWRFNDVGCMQGIGELK